MRSRIPTFPLGILFLSALLASCAPAGSDKGGLFDDGDHAFAEALAEQALAGTDGALLGVDGFRARSVEIDALGMVHARFDQFEGDIPVFEGQAIVHLHPSGEIAGITDGFVRGFGVDLDPVVTLDEAVALASAFHLSGIDSAGADLQILRRDKRDHLTFRVQIDDFLDGTPSMPVIFVDAHTGQIVWEYDNLQTARNRRTYSANNGTSLPGSLRRSETTGNTGDTAVDDAHNFAGITYDYYWNEQGRDSYNNAGADLVSTAHYSNNYDNAFWNGSQMVYGDGGTYFYPLSGSLDVVAHELTHAVTERTANLTYSGQSGGLNEATSDILGVSVDAWSSGWTITADTWKLGEDIAKPALGGALRYMDNPPADGVSIDNYADYYNGLDVHYSSGIANKWFYLVVNDAAVTMAQAADIWYRALTLYMTPSTTFAQARTATESATTDLFGSSSAQLTAVRNAWNGVGVGGTVTYTAFDTRSGLSGSTGSAQNFQFAKPTGATAVQFAMSGGTGDADLYVRFGAAPTTTTFDCRPFLNGNNETCAFNPAQTGTYHVMVRAYSTYSGLTLTASQSGATTTPVEVCTDGIDNDSDGATDCADSDCTTNPACTVTPPEVCTDGVDNDGDGATDCADSDCAAHASCVVTCAGQSDPGSMSGSGAINNHPTDGSSYLGYKYKYYTGGLDVTLDGPATGTDFDLYLYRWQGNRWTEVDSGLTSSSAETVNYGTSGYYAVRVTSYSGSGSYDLCID